ncbi:hypothetical protein AG1IA_07843 [Rhizoctonia solani AG-1 IA]|uniref:BCS1 N-terminal domain-containing protein n=1 Tax=Thanatephorus cucumeris (strain AG1-IA) TaxID=983506 RepID=L8WJL9_THACA|nr:hypothetical protein AG1IA_07843 [Rhizoctonia solani AG-1 IA]
MEWTAEHMVEAQEVAVPVPSSGSKAQGYSVTTEDIRSERGGNNRGRVEWSYGNALLLHDSFLELDRPLEALALMHESIATTVGLGRGIPSVFSKSFNALSPHVRDSTSGILIGAVIDVTRRIFDALWSWISTNCTVTATFESGNEAFEWISEWLQPGYTSSRDFDVIARPRTRTLSSIAVPSPGMSALYSKHSAPHNDGSLAQYLPSHAEQNVYERRLRTRIQYRKDYSNVRACSNLTLTRSEFSTAQLVHIFSDGTSRAYRKSRPRTSCPRPFFHLLTLAGRVDRYGNWRRLSSKPHRDFGSVVLEPEVKRQLLEDANEFLGNERWYADRGIPYRRGNTGIGQV